MASNFDAMQKQRMEKDLHELQTLIAKHFECRKKDDAELSELEDRIAKRKEERAEQMRIRQEREKQRMQREKEERQKREEDEAQRKKEEEEKKKAAISAMNTGHGGKRRERKGGKVTEREKKKKILADRRKPLNIDHLQGSKLQEKVKEMFDWLAQLELEKYDCEERYERQRYDIGMLRKRVQDYMAKSGKGGTQQRKQIKTLSSINSKTSAFK